MQAALGLLEEADRSHAEARALLEPLYRARGGRDSDLRQRLNSGQGGAGASDGEAGRRSCASRPGPMATRPAGEVPREGAVHERVR